MQNHRSWNKPFVSSGLELLLVSKLLRIMKKRDLGPHVSEILDSRFQVCYNFYHLESYIHCGLVPDEYYNYSAQSQYNLSKIKRFLYRTYF